MHVAEVGAALGRSAVPGLSRGLQPAEPEAKRRQLAAEPSGCERGKARVAAKVRADQRSTYAEVAALLAAAREAWAVRRACKAGGSNSGAESWATRSCAKRWLAGRQPKKAAGA